MVLVVREVDAAVVPRVAVATSGLEAGKRCLGSVAGSMLEQGSGRVSILASVEDGREGGHAAWLAEPVEHATRFVVTKVRASGRVGTIDRRFGSLEELGLEEGQRVLERVRLGARKSTTDSVGVQAVHDQMVEQKVDGIFQPTGIVARKDEMKALDLFFLSIDGFGLRFLKLSIDNMLRFELLDNVGFKLG